MTIFTTARTQRSYRNLTLMPWTFRGNIANVGRLLLAVLWTMTWGTWRGIRSAAEYAYAWQNDGKPRWPSGWRWHFMWGRHRSPKAMLCDGCGWVGPLRWAVHTYRAAGHDDVEPVDECPRCGREETLLPVLRGKKGWCA